MAASICWCFVLGPFLEKLLLVSTEPDGMGPVQTEAGDSVTGSVCRGGLLRVTDAGKVTWC